MGCEVELVVNVVRGLSVVPADQTVLNILEVGCEVELVVIVDVVRGLSVVPADQVVLKTDVGNTGSSPNVRKKT